MSGMTWRSLFPQPRSTGAGRATPFTDGQLELLKWIALGSMLVDHVGRYGFGMGLDSWAFAVGRVAFPLFAIVLGMNLGREGDQAARCFRVARRLAVWAVISAVPAWLARGEWLPVNVFATLALGAVVAGAAASREISQFRRVIVIGVACAAAATVEFGLPGVLLVAGIALRRVGREGLAWRIVASVAFALLVVLNTYFGGLPAGLATAGSLAIALLAMMPGRDLPRSRLIFYVTYPVHLLAVGAAIRLMG